jgi:L-lactate dehydrogenase complex protein LldE
VAAKEVALFVTCLTDTFEPRVGVAVVRLLRHFGCAVRFPAEQTCCGQPQFNNGYHTEAAALGRRMIDVFEPYEAVVTPSGSCASMVKHHLPELLAEEPSYGTRARALADRTWEFGQFCVDQLRIDPAEISAPPVGPMTYHYSCHLRGLQTYAEATRLVADMRDVDFRPLERLDQCCGFGGAFHVLYPEVSTAMVDDKLDSIARTGATTVVCNEAGCGMTIGGAARRRGMNLRLLHVAELWAEGLGLMADHPAQETTRS